MESSSSPPGPPYDPPTAVVGGLPTVHVDVPISAVFIAVYLSLALANIRIASRNRSRGHKFLMQVLLIPYCMSRVLTCALRISWATKPHNISLGIAAQIFVGAGVLALYLFNVLFTQRILRAMHPEIGWHSLIRALYKAFYALLVCALILLITLTVINFYTLNPHTHSIAKWVLRGVTVYILIFAISPLPTLALCYLLPRSAREEQFGEGSIARKALVVAITTCFCTVIAGFRLGTTWSAPRMKADPAWYDSRPAFYCFGFTMEILTLSSFLLGQVHKRFHVPDGSSKRATYAIDDEGTRTDSSGEGLDDLEKASI